MGNLSSPRETRVCRIVILALGSILALHFLFTVHDEGFEGGFTILKSPQQSAGNSLPPVRTITPFPRKIWQTGKHGPASLDDESKDAIKTWQKMNQNWRYEILTDYSAETYVRDTFASRPDIIDLYTDIGDPILRADLLRYLVLLGDGGVYSVRGRLCLVDVDSLIEKMPLGYGYEVTKTNRRLDSFRVQKPSQSRSRGGV